ncbi:MAG: hypothetical protein JW936_09055 [Sedimentisphaerales bacterium]|nr:hypothetical protein [Sedimentisphaerales bacterium]
MDLIQIRTRYLTTLLQSDRVECRKVLGEALQTGTPATTIYTELFWPVMVELEQIFRNHQIDQITYQMAVRINRTLVDQLQSKLPCGPKRNKKMIVVCGDGEPEELGAQMCADLFESDGWTVHFLGGGVPNDEILSMIGRIQPEITFIYGTQPSGAPGVRQLIDHTRDISACPHMRFMLSGGLFNRAEGLWEEIGADLFAPTASEALKVALTDQRAAPTKKRSRRNSASKEEELEAVLS